MIFQSSHHEFMSFELPILDITPSQIHCTNWNQLIFSREIKKSCLHSRKKFKTRNNSHRYENFSLTLWKLQKFTLAEKKFRQINYLVISLVKPLLSRDFCEKSVRENFCNFHTVQFSAKIPWNQLYHWKLRYEVVSRNIFSVRDNFAFFQTAQCGNCRNSL